MIDITINGTACTVQYTHVEKTSSIKFINHRICFLQKNTQNQIIAFRSLNSLNFQNSVFDICLKWLQLIINKRQHFTLEYLFNSEDKQLKLHRIPSNYLNQSLKIKKILNGAKKKHMNMQSTTRLIFIYQATIHYDTIPTKIFTKVSIFMEEKK